MPPDTKPYTDFSVHVAPINGEGTDVAVFGELDLATLGAVKNALDKAVDRGGNVVLDLRACGFVDSKGIGLIAKTAIRLRDAERTLILRGVQYRVRRILELTGLSESELMIIEPEAEAPSSP